MALMAVLRFSSRAIASRLDFWTKKRMKSSDAKVATMIISIIVKPFLFIKIFLVVLGGIEPPHRRSGGSKLDQSHLN